jgi:hypothetical protein
MFRLAGDVKHRWPISAKRSSSRYKPTRILKKGWPLCGVMKNKLDYTATGAAGGASRFFLTTCGHCCKDVCAVLTNPLTKRIFYLY